VTKPSRTTRDKTPVTHPQWCDPRLCTTGSPHGDITHRSESQTLVTGVMAHPPSMPFILDMPEGDERWHFHLHRTDEPRIEDIGPAMLVIEMTDLSDAREPVTTVLLELHDLDALIDHLIIERNRARFLDGLVTR
jgi:hypothetical protein